MADVEARYANFGPLDDAKQQANTFMRKTKRGGVSIVRKGKRLAGRVKSAVIGDTWAGTGVRAAGLAGAILARKPIMGIGKRAGFLALGGGRRAMDAAGGFAGSQYRSTMRAGARTARDIGQTASDLPSRAASALEDVSSRVRGMAEGVGSSAVSFPRTARQVITID